jgi:prevent-host-death family protein
MHKSVSAAEANRRFSQLLRTVREGHSYVVTSHGKQVAKIVPIGKDDEVTKGARAALLARLCSERVTDVGGWTREELYEDLR